VTRNTSAVLNPLTDERILVREFIGDFAGSSRLEVLGTLDQQSMSPTDIDYQGAISRQTASKHLAQFTDLGLTKPMRGDGGYELTAGGKVVLDAFDTCLSHIDREALTHLTRSTHSLSLLRRLSRYPARPSELADNGSDAPSRATVQRELGRFESHGWAKELNGHQQITRAGKRVLDAYDELAVTIEQVMEKAPWFQRLDQSRADVPVRELHDAKLYVSSPNSPGIVLAAALKLCDPRLDHFRVLTSIFNPTLFRAYDMLLKLGLEGEAIVDAFLYDRLHEEGMEHFLDDSDYDGFDIFRLEESLTLGIAIYDEEQVAIGTYNEVGDGEHIAMILSSNEALVDWGTELFDSFREQALPAIDQSAETVSQ
jgi:predicted transcriptional regulator